MTGSPVWPIVSSDTPVVEVMKRLDESGAERAVVLGQEREYLCQVAPSDIRRQLLAGLDLHAAVGDVVVPSPLYLLEAHLAAAEHRRALALELQAAGQTACPLVDPRGRFIRLVSLEELGGEARTNGRSVPGATNVHNVLVVGGGGYLGSVLVRELLGRGYRVRVLDNFMYGRATLQEVSQDQNLEVVEADFRNIQTIVTCLADIDAVVLLAAVVGDPASQLRPTQTIETNLLAAQALAFACKAQQVNRFLYASTCSVYGAGDGLLTEDAPLRPVSLYARTKIASEQSILQMADGAFAPTILRMGTLYGYAPRMRFDLVVNTMTMSAFVDGRIMVFGGRQWRPLLHVRDAAQAYVACLEAKIDAVRRMVFNVGSEEQNYQIERIAGVVSAALGGVPIDCQSSSLDTRDYRVSFERIRTVLRFEAQHQVGEASQEIYEHLRTGRIRNPRAKVFYNHYFDSTEE